MRAGCLVFLLVLPAQAFAVEGETAMSAVPGLAAVTLTQTRAGRGVQRSGYGGGLTLDYQRALSDTLWFRVGAGASLHGIDGDRSFVGVGTVGLTYAIDVFRYVPYLSGGVGAMVVGGGALETEVRPYLQVGVGVDVLQSRTWSWGIDARFSSFVSEAAYFTIGPKIAVRWGYF